MPEIKDHSVLVEDEKIIEDLISSEFGELKDSKLELTFTEALYLYNNGRLSLKKSKKNFLDFVSNKEKKFELKFLVYKDLRERGLFLKDGGKTADFYLYDRGDKPSNDSFSNLVFVLSEREEIEISKLLKKTKHAKRLRKNSIIAFVDGEGDITYYRLKAFRLKGELENNYDFEVEAKLLGDRIIAWENGSRLYANYFYGKPFLEDSFQLTFLEAHHLSKKDVLNLDVDKIKKRGTELDSKFGIKARVYEDLREKGLVPKTGFKFGTHFRVYKDFVSPENLSHAKYLVQALEPNTKLNPPEISRAVRLAQNVRKKMLFAIVNNDISYLELKRIKI